MKLSRHAHAFAATCIPLPSSAHSYSNSVGLPPKQRTGPTRHARGPYRFIEGASEDDGVGCIHAKGGRETIQLLEIVTSYVQLCVVGIHV
jgi:hypothetical protein